MSEKREPWFVYILECNDGTYYTGITNDLDSRMKKHIEGKGSRYVLSRGFKRLVASNVFEDKSKALKEEYRIKKLSRLEKLKEFKQ